MQSMYEIKYRSRKERIFITTSIVCSSDFATEQRLEEQLQLQKFEASVYYVANFQDLFLRRHANTRYGKLSLEYCISQFKRGE
jgi:hypothetical protein